MLILGTVLAFQLLLSCTTPSRLEVDPSRIESWSGTLSARVPMSSPFVEHYRKGRFRLSYLAARHEVSAASRTFQLIEQLFKPPHFKIVILEGFPNAYGVNPAGMTKYATEKGVREDALAIRLAVHNHVPFLGGEPPEPTVARAVLGAGFSEQDLMGFYFVRQVPTLQREGAFERQSMRQVFDEFMHWQKMAAGLPKDFQFDLNDFESWYSRTNHKDFALNTFDPEEPTPLGDGKYLTQRISSIVGKVRDQFIVKTIADALNEYGEVLVIYGASHLETQRPALVQMLGTPKSRAR